MEIRVCGIEFEYSFNNDNYGAVKLKGAKRAVRSNG
jgi:hypothetical protein